MSVERFHSNQRMSQAVVDGNTIYLSGQVAADPSADITSQARSVLDRVDALLVETESSRENILSATVILKNMSDFSTFNEVWDAWVVEGKPSARACIQAELALPELLVEVCIIAKKIVA